MYTYICACLFFDPHAFSIDDFAIKGTSFESRTVIIIGNVLKTEHCYTMRWTSEHDNVLMTSLAVRTQNTVRTQPPDICWPMTILCSSSSQNISIPFDAQINSAIFNENALHKHLFNYSTGHVIFLIDILYHSIVLSTFSKLCHDQSISSI